jgi:hypothetical protein
MVPNAFRNLLFRPLLLSFGLAAALATPAGAATDFRDIPYLQARVGQVLERERNGVEVQWLNEATGNSGTIRVLRTFYKDATVPCRDYARTTNQTGAPALLVRGTGCRDASGRWQLKEGEETTAETPPSGATSSQGGGTPPGGQIQGQTESWGQGQTQGQTESWGQGQTQGQTESWGQGQTQGQTETWGQGQTQGQWQTQGSGQQASPTWEPVPATEVPTPLFEPEAPETPPSEGEPSESQPAAAEPAPAQEEEIPIVMPTPSE